MQEIDMPKTYDSAVVEKIWVEKWINAGLYQRNAGVPNEDGNVCDFTITIPPPNVTGILHIGHAMDDTIQDVLVRQKRMQGYSTRWIIGCDHAGISTQTKVDKKLKSEGISRLEIGREKFIDACWAWTRQYGGTIIEQIKRMGCSADFEDEKFTMDEDYAVAVRKVFCEWYKAGLIYRGKRIVNWCPSCKTAISDDEAEYKPEHGHLWYLRYPLKEEVAGQRYVVVATTRPETMLGDTGIAVSPADPSKEAFIGKTVVLPIVNREIPIFADYHVDAEFGTGFVKVTPAHDPNDYAMGQAHDLEQINIFDESAHVIDGYGAFSGLDRDQARTAVLEWFEAHDLLEKTEEITHSVMHCYRCDTALEPWLSAQWFVAVDKLKNPAIAAVKDGRVQFNSKRWEQSYFTWMENLRDWCISRQLWWGHRIPVFTCEKCGWQDASMTDIEVCPVCGSTQVSQDPDVLDTWFSSQLWPFATQGWPQHPEERDGHYPTSALVTARDIIALWVARMIMASEYFCASEPFKDVIIYPTILAKDGSRMSKSKGNGVDPIDLIEKYGADAMRFNLLQLVTANQDVRFDAQHNKNGSFKCSLRTEQARSFITKIWNASRFCLMNMDGYTPGAPVAQTPEDKWMLSKLARQVAQTNASLAAYKFGEYAKDLERFFWQDVCDWYIELAKVRLSGEDENVRLTAQRNLVFVLDTCLRLSHPAIPFVTEEVWQRLPQSTLSCKKGTGEQYLMQAAWPREQEYASFVDLPAEKTFELAKRLIGGVRSVRARLRLSPAAPLSIVVRANAAVGKQLLAQKDFIEKVAKLSSCTVAEDVAKPAASVAVIDSDFELYVVVGDLADLGAEAAKIKKDREKAEKELAAVQKTLANEGFLAKAAQDVIEQKQMRLQELSETIERLTAELQGFS